MAFTYDPTLGTDKDRVRWLVADTQDTEPLQQDEEIVWVLTMQPNIYRAAATIAKQISRYFARQCDIAVLQEVSISLGQRAKAYNDLARQLEDDANKGLGGGVGAYAGGISVSDMQAQEGDADRVVPAFTRATQNTRAVPTSTWPGPEEGEDG